jgi:outer membrane immunogenic protein
MKILTAGLLCALCGVAYAGPKTEMKQVAAAEKAPNWTGFYLGGFVGYKYDVADTNIQLTGAWTRSYDDLHNNSNMDTSGFELGGLMGYNYQFQNNWVVGMEITGAYLWLGKDSNTGYVGDDHYLVNTSLKTHYLVTIGPRIGYSFGKWFPYITGGLALGDIDFNQIVGAQYGSNSQYGHADPTKAGWMVGAGVQYAITEHWSARLQYEFIDLGSASFNSAWAPPSQDYTGSNHASLEEHNISAAIIYQF